MSRQPVRNQALAYLRNGNVIIRWAETRMAGPRRPYLVKADVIGQQSTYLIEFDEDKNDGAWTCTCGNGDCRHIAAVQLVTGHESAASK